MSRWTSSLRLRRDLLAVCACLAAFACPAAAWAAGGTPMPAPDDPPGGSSPRRPRRPTKPASRPGPRSAPRSRHGCPRPTPGGRLVARLGRDEATSSCGQAATVRHPTPRSRRRVEPGSGAAAGPSTSHDSVGTDGAPRRTERRIRARRRQSPGRRRRSRSASHRARDDEAVERTTPAARKPRDARTARAPGCRPRRPRPGRRPARRVARRRGAPACSRRQAEAPSSASRREARRGRHEHALRA